MKFRVAALAPVMLAAAATLAAAGVARASAPYPPDPPVVSASVDPGTPVSPEYCSGDVCAQVYRMPGARQLAYVNVRVWARSRTFFGHFELQVPSVYGPLKRNSGDTSNNAGGFGYLTEEPNNPGRFTVTAYKKTGPQSWVGISSTWFSGKICC